MKTDNELIAEFMDEEKSILKFESHHFDMPKLEYSSGLESRPFRKTPLTNKQQKKRAANKRAKLSRKRNRGH